MVCCAESGTAAIATLNRNRNIINSPLLDTVPKAIGYGSCEGEWEWFEHRNVQRVRERGEFLMRSESLRQAPKWAIHHSKPAVGGPYSSQKRRCGKHQADFPEADLWAGISEITSDAL